MILDSWFQDIPQNADFYSRENLNFFFVRVMQEYNFATSKPIVFLPCSRTKPYSKSLTHSYMSAITRNPLFEKIVLSEPLAVVPYSMEHLAPQYDYHPNDMTPKDRWQMVRRIGIFLDRLKALSPSRERIYFVGGRHHLLVLQDANAIGSPYFELIAIHPARGIRDYAKCAKELARKIIFLENLNKQITLEAF